MPNPYFVPLYPHKTLGMILQEIAGRDKQGISTSVLKALLLCHSELYIQKWGKEAYDELLAKLSLDAVTQGKLKLEKEREKQAKREERLALKRKSLELKERELNIREINSGMRVDDKQQKTNELVVERERLQNRLSDCSTEESKKWTENRIKEINEKLGEEQA